jgi:uracil-DNA glycosylase
VLTRQYAAHVPIIANCPGCPYRQFGPAIGTRGNAAEPIVLVGEAPGAKEIVDRTPFVGRAGEVLWNAAAAAGLTERDVFVVNSVACRPFNPATPKVRTPSLVAIDACRRRREDDIGAHRRSAVVALGRTALQAITGLRGYRVMKEAPDTELPSEWGTVVATLHPAYVLRRGADGPERRRLVADLTHAGEIGRGSA